MFFCCAVSTILGRHANNRGAGIKFGPNVVDEFLKTNGFLAVIRSHECVENGFEWPYRAHDLLVTVFSGTDLSPPFALPKFIYI